MTRVIIDEALKAKLDGAAGLVEICDTSGQTLGFFRSLFDKSEYEGVDCPIPEGELRRRVAEGKGRPLKEILAELENQG